MIIPRRPDWLVAALTLLIGGVLAALSVMRYAGYNAGMLDLGNMAQAIWSGSQGQPLLYTFKDGNFSRLAVHVELIYFLLAPLYALWPDPRALLVAQAGLFALGALPAYRLTLRRTESRFAARCLALCYLLYPAALTSVLFDLHGDTLAMPLLMFLIEALDRRAWRAAGVWAALALACKFYVALPVGLLGLYLWRWRGERRAGLVLFATGAAYGALAFFVVRLLFTGPTTAERQKGLAYVSYYFGAWGELVATLDQRLLSAIVVLGPLLLLAWRGWRLLLPALPLALAALLSTGPGGAFDFRYHHYAIVVPFVIAAAVEGLASLKKRADRGERLRRPWRGDAALSLAIVAIFAALLVDTPLNPLFWLAPPGKGLDASAYGRTERDALKDAWLRARVPDGAPIAASNFLAPHLTNRETLYLVRYPDEPEALRLPEHLAQIDYAVADALFDYATPVDDSFAGGITYDASAIATLLRDPAWGLAEAHDGLLLFQRGLAPATALPQRAERLVAGDAAPTTRFGEAIGLLDAEITPLEGRRVRLRFDWVALRDLRDRPPLVAVSRIVGVDGARIAHLPTLALAPTSGWGAGEVVREEFEVRLPDGLAPGSYRVLTGWYDSGHIGAAVTDTRSRVGDEAVTGEITAR